MRVDRETHIEIAIRLDAIGQSMNDAVSINTTTGELLKHAAFLLKRASRNMCNKGMLGCSGDDCDSDSHK